jgi:hypothetical protein
MIVAITDGRANVSLAKSTMEPGTDPESIPKATPEEIKAEILQVSARIGASGMQVRCLRGTSASRTPPSCAVSHGSAERAHTRPAGYTGDGLTVAPLTHSRTA